MATGCLVTSLGKRRKELSFPKNVLEPTGPLRKVVPETSSSMSDWARRLPQEPEA